MTTACVLSLLFSHTAESKESTKKPKVVHVCKKTDTAESILACNIYREARGDGDPAMLGVGFVTINRKDHEKFPSTIRKIVYQLGQFSWTNFNKSFKVYEKDSWIKSKGYAKVLIRLHTENKIAYDTLDLTHGSLYYHDKSIHPYWAKGLKHTVNLGDLVFYKEKESANK